MWNTLLQLFGEYGASKTRLRLIGYDTEKQRGTLRCSRETLPQVRATISMVSAVKDTPAALHVISVSGTLKKLRENETQI